MATGNVTTMFFWGDFDDVDHDDARELVVLLFGHRESRAEIDDWNHGAAQVHHSTYERRCVRDRRDFRAPFDLLHLQNLNAVFLVLKGKCEKPPVLK